MFKWKLITELSEGNTVLLHSPDRLAKIKSIEKKLPDGKQEIIITMTENNTGKEIVQQHNAETDQYRAIIN